jgi:pseudouridine-5'-phosphate glycosidase
MPTRFKGRIRFSEGVAGALGQAQAVVALESTVIAHGLPRPIGLQVALECQQIVSRAGAIPATIGIVAGAPTIGLSHDELATIASGQAPDGNLIEKVSLNNLAATIIKNSWGATTVAASIRIASLGGSSYLERRPLVFSTGGIGGVHRLAEQTFDISADLVALATTQIVCVAAGAKTILDLPKTRQVLETLGIPVIGYRTAEFPAFYSRHSGLQVDATIQTPEEAASLALAHWEAGAPGAILVCAPVPEEFALPPQEIEPAIEEALRAVEQSGARGGEITPLLLRELERLTGGKTLEANRALLINNAELAAHIAMSLNCLLSTR